MVCEEEGATKLKSEGLGGSFKYVLFSTLFGEMIQLDSYLSNGLVQPPTSLCMVHTCLHESHGENHVGTFRIIEPIRVFTSDSATATARAAVDGNGESTCGNCEVVQSGWNRHCTVSTNNVEVMT